MNKGVITSISYKNGKTTLILKSNYSIIAYINDKTNLKIGDVIIYQFSKKEVTKNTVFNNFNYKEYLKSLNIRSAIIINNYKLVKRGNLLYNFKNRINTLIEKKESKSYIKTFLCSDKSELEKSVKDVYQQNGISHMLAVSGFHVIFLLSFLKSLLRKTFLGERKIMICLVIFSLFYLFISNFSVSLLRASLLYFMTYFNNKYDFNLSKITIYLLILNICLFNKPFLIFNISFWYTFLLSFFLIINKRTYDSRIKDILYVSFFAFIVSSPLTIYLNYQINLLSIIYNILFFTVVCYVIYHLSFIALFAGFIDNLLYKIIYLFEYVNVSLCKINCFKINVPHYNLYLLIIMYLMLFLFVYKSKYKYLIMYVLTILIIRVLIYFDNYSYIYFIDVKQGDAILYLSKNRNKSVLIDTGGIKNNDYLYSNLVTFFESIGVYKIDYLILSHGDYDHMGEAINLVKNFKVEKVIFNCGSYNELEQELIKVLDKKKIPYYSCIKELNINNNKLYFLQTKEYDNENDNSNVIYTELSGSKFMFMGDAGINKEKDILEKYNISNIDVLKVGHHGSKTSSSKDFINEIKPTYSIISVGKSNRYGHPNKEVLNSLNDSKIYRTDEDGSIMFKIKNKKLNIETCIP